MLTSKCIYALVTNCDDLSCGANEICVEAGDTYECVCHSDYEGENCEDISKFYLHYCV